MSIPCEVVMTLTPERNAPIEKNLCVPIVSLATSNLGFRVLSKSRTNEILMIASEILFQLVNLSLAASFTLIIFHRCGETARGLSLGFGWQCQTPRYFAIKGVTRVGNA